MPPSPAQKFGQHFLKSHVPPVISRIFNPAALPRDYLNADQSLIIVLSNFVINLHDIIYKEAGNKYIAKFKTAYFAILKTKNAPQI
jgi:hypothetical protein